MKLKWVYGNGGRYTAEGKSYSYAIIYDPASRWPFRCLQMRQPGGQVINRNATLSMIGAQARAQVWEDNQ